MPVTKHFPGFISRFLLIVLAIILPGCSSSLHPRDNHTPAPVPSSPLPIISVSQPTQMVTSLPTVTPNTSPTLNKFISPTPSLTATASLTPTPYPKLTRTGPNFVLFTADQNGRYKLLFYEQSAQGRQEFVLPVGINWERLRSASLSPNGKWLAVSTVERVNDLAIPRLDIVEIASGRILPVARLAALDYPERQAKLVDLLPQAYPGLFPEYILKEEDPWWKTELTDYYTETLGNYDWSPDSSTLAFGAQIDGLSTDVYLFNLQNQHSTRLVNDLLPVGGVTWSPTGEWIVLENVIPVGMQNIETIHVLDPKDGLVRNPPILTRNFYHPIWISSYQVIGADYGEEGGWDVRVIDVATGQVTMLWDYDFWDLVVDPVHDVVALCALPPSYYGKTDADYPPAGIYLISFDGRVIRIRDSDVYYLFQAAGGVLQFIGDDGTGLYLINADGTKTLFSEPKRNPKNVERSADSHWLAICSEEDGLEIYDEYNHLAYAFPGIDTDDFSWAPDSAGIFYRLKNTLYYLALATGESRPIYDCFLDNDCWALGWTQ